ncbi:acyl-CoA synthetase [Octopus vulgaris]|uniref:Acyl-CoA synthetase n=1 Tax=Octopus vulgaris TaxID=6645 RepID=A0AA36F6Y1_OCTVU|nr:acyl-CoA synthetase [Octopus vulgaris]
MTSYIHEPGRIPAVWQTIPEKLKCLAEEQPNKLAFVVYKEKDDRQQLTRKEVYDGTVKFAKALVKLGVKKGDHVALCISNCVDLIIYDTGIIMAGAVSLRLSLKSGDFKDIFSGCKAVIFDSKDSLDKFCAIAQISDDGKVTSEIYPELKFVINISNTYCPSNVLSATNLMLNINDSEQVDLPNLDPEDIAFICQTSGSTGRPKNIYHTHYNWLNSIVHAMDASSVTSDDTTYNTRPMIYIGGYPFGLFSVGTTHVTGNVQMLNDIKNLEFIENIWKKEGCNILWLLPQHLQLLRDCGHRAKAILTGGDMLTKESLMHSLNFTEHIQIVYGSSEATFLTSRVFTKKNISEHLPKMLGRPFPDTEMKIVDDNGKTVNIGEVGNIEVRNKWTAKINLDGDSTNTNGWQSMSDIGYMTPEGDFFLVGRNTDFIKKSTVKVPVRQVEEYVSHHPSVEDVVVVPIPDEEVGERVCACITIRDNHEFNEDGLKKFCLEIMPQQSGFDIVTLHPDYFLHFTSFPLLTSQKFDRRSIKSTAIALVEKNIKKKNFLQN